MLRNESATTVPAPLKPKVRADSIDALRGLVMVLMALDHARDFWTVSGTDPKDLTKISVVLFLTRYVTNLCAPVFVFLAGLASYLSLAGGKSKRALSGFLLKRGLWLVLLEITLMHFIWSFDLSYRVTELQVIWAIGWSMVALSGVVFLPLWLTGVLSMLMIAGHNLLDSIHAADLGTWGALWHILHEQGDLFELGGHQVIILYPLIPWIGVMAAGYASGKAWFKWRERRWQYLWKAGLTLLAVFITLKSVNTYGDLESWSHLDSPLFTFLSFMKITKYPPSLDFLLITLGVAFLILAVVERFAFLRLKLLVILGRVPMFYYVGHICLLHSAAAIIALCVYGAMLPGMDFVYNPFPGYGYTLGVAYLAWIVAVLAMYPVCGWFAEIKNKSRNPILSYF